MWNCWNAVVPTAERAASRRALRELEAEPGGAVMLGDSWTADIEGALAVGMRAVWFNPNRHPRPARRADVEEIHSLHPAAAVADIVLRCSVP